jgi:hypothetical protein
MESTGQVCWRKRSHVLIKYDARGEMKVKLHAFTHTIYKCEWLAWRPVRITSGGRGARFQLGKRLRLPNTGKNDLRMPENERQFLDPIGCSLVGVSTKLYEYCAALYFVHLFHCEILHKSVAVSDFVTAYVKSSSFRDVTKFRLVFGYRWFGTTYRTHLQE